MEILWRSWELAKACFHVLRRDKEILVLPLISGAIAISILLALAISFFHSPMLFIFLLIATAFLSPIFFAFLGVLLEAAVVGCATIRLQGGDPKVREGLKIAARNWWNLFQWALICIIVGLILGFIRAMLQSRRNLHRSHEPVFSYGPMTAGPTHRLNGPVGFTGGGLGIPGPDWGWGDIIVGALEMAWSVATFFVIPVIVYEKLSPLKAIKRSVEIIRNILGETLILKLGFKVLFGFLGGLGILAIIAGIMNGVAFVPNPAGSAVVSGQRGDIVITNAAALIGGFAGAIAYWLALGCISFTLIGILKAALYEYARRGQVEPSAELPQTEFNPLNNIIRSFQKGIQAEAPQPTPRIADIADVIKKLAELKDKGMLTEEEFQAMKRKLLEKY